VVDLQQGDYEEMDQLAIAKPLCKAAFPRAARADIGIGLARAIRAAVRAVQAASISTCRPSVRPGNERRAGRQVAGEGVDEAPRRSRSRCSQNARSMWLKGAKRPLIILGKGAAYAQADGCDPRLRSRRAASPSCR